NRIVGMAAENHVDTAKAAGKLEVDVHAVMGKQHDRVDLVGIAQAIDKSLHFLLADSEGPVRRKPFRMRDRNIGKGLTDHGNAVIADLLDRGRLEYPAGSLVESFGAVEAGFLGQVDVLRQEFALE